MVQRIEDDRAVSALADLLNGSARRRPVVVVTTPTGVSEPRIDAEVIAADAGDLADVYVLPTGPLTWRFSELMPSNTHVFGGAGRVYPVGHEWIAALAQSPLRMSFNENDAAIATRLLEGDVFRMAAAAGLLNAPSKRSTRVSGQVQGLIPWRAFVDVDRRFPALVVAELTVDGVPIDQVLAPGLRVTGLFDPDSRRRDIRGSLLSADNALSGYDVGDVVLAIVDWVGIAESTLMLYPEIAGERAVVTLIQRSEVTDTGDGLRTLMTAGEVLRARVTAVGPSWGLTLVGVSDDDGAVGYRVSLQVNTPSARRLHFWKLPSGTIELSRVVLHDDFDS